MKQGRIFLLWGVFFLLLLKGLSYERNWEQKELLKEWHQRELELYGAALEGREVLDQAILSPYPEGIQKAREELTPRGIHPEDLRRKPRALEEWERKKKGRESMFLLILSGGVFSFLLFESFEERKKNRDILHSLEFLIGKREGFFTEFRGERGEIEEKVQELEEVLGRQRERLREREKAMRGYLEDISHQIRTPLASVGMMNELMLEDPEMDPRIRRDFLEKIGSQNRRISALVESLLKFAKLDSGLMPMKRKPTDLRRLWEEAEDALWEKMEEKNLRVSIIGEAQASVDPGWTYEVIFNLLKNATEHTPKEKEILVRLGEGTGYARMEIENEGERISSEALLRIFDRFYKTEKSLPDSVGIGLNLAKTIITRQKGTISVQNTPRGVSFLVVFYSEGQEERNKTQKS